MMLKQTKIVASISDQRCEVEFIRDLFKAGMNVVRMNTAHASREGFEKLITNVREVSNRIANPFGAGTDLTAAWNGAPVSFHGATIKPEKANPDLRAANGRVSLGFSQGDNGAHAAMRISHRATLSFSIGI